MKTLTISPSIRTALVTAALLLLPAGAMLAQAQIEIIGGTTIDWGDVPPEKLERKILITNTGSDTLNVGNVRPSCGCTLATLDDPNIAPGDTVVLPVAIDMTYRTGVQTKKIWITSNAEKTPTLELSLQARVLKDVTASSPIFQLPNHMEPNTPATSSVTVTNSGKETITVEPPTVVRSQGADIRFEPDSPTTLKPGESMEVTAVVTPTGEGTDCNATVRIHTSAQYVKELTFTVYGQVSNTTATETGTGK